METIIYWLQSISASKELEADLRAIQQVESYGMLKTKSQTCTIVEKAKETALKFYEKAAKVLQTYYINGLTQ